jgi:hypothetical protein
LNNLALDGYFKVTASENFKIFAYYRTVENFNMPETEYRSPTYNKITLDKEYSVSGPKGVEINVVSFDIDYKYDIEIWREKSSFSTTSEDEN